MVGIVIFLIALTAVSWWFYRNLYRQFDQALGQRLQGIARASAALVDGSWIARFKPGDEETGLYKVICKRLAGVREAHQVKSLYVFGPDNRSLVDATGEKGIGDTYYRLLQDQTELAEVWKGMSAY